MLLNDAGRMIGTTWNEIPVSYPGIELDVMQIMPNHLHGIITQISFLAPGLQVSSYIPFP
jgi:REP element-mobilizing transposase RayT